jgi:hypothetical protein
MMETIADESKKRDNSSRKVMVVALIFATAVIMCGILLLYLQPSAVNLEKKSLETAFRSGSPEFERLTKKIIISTDEKRLMESPTALGSIMMSIGGKMKNFSGETLTLVEINVAVVDMNGAVIKDKDVIIVPRQVDVLPNGGELPMTIVIEGFSKDEERANVRWKVTAIKTQ